MEDGILTLDKIECLFINNPPIGGYTDIQEGECETKIQNLSKKMLGFFVFVNFF